MTALILYERWGRHAHNPHMGNHSYKIVGEGS